MSDCVRVFITEFNRSTRTLRLSGGSEAEFCLDRGRVTAGSASMPICEIELELKSGNRLSLFQLALDLLHSVPQRFRLGWKTSARPSVVMRLLPAVDLRQLKRPSPACR